MGIKRVDRQSPSTRTNYRRKLEGQISNMKSSSMLQYKEYKKLQLNRTAEKGPRIASDKWIETQTEGHWGAQSNQYEKEHDDRMKQLYEVMMDRQRKLFSNKTPVKPRENNLNI